MRTRAPLAFARAGPENASPDPRRSREIHAWRAEWTSGRARSRGPGPPFPWVGRASTLWAPTRPRRHTVLWSTSAASAPPRTRRHQTILFFVEGSLFSHWIMRSSRLIISWLGERWSHGRGLPGLRDQPGGWGGGAEVQGILRPEAGGQRRHKPGQQYGDHCFHRILLGFELIEFSSARKSFRIPPAQGRWS